MPSLMSQVKGGAAEADGRLMQGDQILTVNGNDLRTASQVCLFPYEFGWFHKENGYRGYWNNNLDYFRSKRQPFWRRPWAKSIWRLDAWKLALPVPVQLLPPNRKYPMSDFYLWFSYHKYVWKCLVSFGWTWQPIRLNFFSVFPSIFFW